jgi:hypothetical protein
MMGFYWILPPKIYGISHGISPSFPPRKSSPDFLRCRTAVARMSGLHLVSGTQWHQRFQRRKWMELESSKKSSSDGESDGKILMALMVY